MAAAIPGLQMAIDQLQETLDQIRAQLNGEVKRGRPPGPSQTQSAYWAKMTPEERSAEVKRRVALGRSKAAPPQPEEVGQDQSPSPIKNYWAKMSPRERKAEMKRRVKVSEKNGSPMVGSKSFKGESAGSVQ